MVNLRRGVKRSLLKFYYRKLWVRIAVILLAIVTVPVVVLGVLLTRTSQEAVRNSVLTNYKQIATRTAREINLFIERPLGILDSTAAMIGIIYPASWKQETVLVELVLEQPIFMRAVSGDLSGNQIASSELGRGLSWSYPKEALESVISGKNYISAVKFQDNHTPFVTMAVPIKKMGKTVGILVSDVDLRGVWDIVDNIKIGKTGSAFLVSDDGTLIAHQDKKRVLKNENLSGRREIRSVLSGKTEAIELDSQDAGKWISAYSPVPGFGWGIVLTQSQDEAYLFSKMMKVQSWIIIILSELVAVLVSIFMGKVLVRPIKALATRIKSVAAGDLDHKIAVRTRDDMGELIRSFNEMTRKLKKAKERERLSAIGEAVAWITHELKNSLVSIKSFIQIFPQRHNDEKFVHKFNRILPEEIERMERIFKELSDFSSNYELKKTDTDVKAVMDGILEMLKDGLAEKKIELKYYPEHADFYMEADPVKLKQVFVNLIINSINAMPAGGQLSVSIRQICADALRSSGIEVRIKDTGEGMTKEAQGKIFEPFHTTKNGGMGLGLTISRRIIQQHGGDIWVESGLGEGTTFTVRLPAKITDPANARRWDNIFKNTAS